MSNNPVLLEEAIGNLPTTSVAPEIANIFRYLSNHEKVIFHAQQIDDPHVCNMARFLLAERCFLSNRLIFLQRFGRFFKEEHLHAFAQHAICQGSAPEVGEHENIEEMQIILKDLHKKLQNKGKIIRNRRYTYMQKMIKGGNDYFSEQEMMLREPELYHELIGQYLSEADKKERDKYDVHNTKISEIIMMHFKNQQTREIFKDIVEKKKQESLIKSQEKEEAEKKEVEVENYGKQWGNFDDEEVPCSSKKPRSNEIEKPPSASLRENKSRNSLITAAERQLLRQEFFSIMQDKFMNGKDKFNYRKVDEDSDLDDLDQIAKDEEDAYFAETDSDSTEDVFHEEVGNTSSDDK